MCTVTPESKVVSIRILMKPFKFSTHGSWSSCFIFCFLFGFFSPFHQSTSKKRLIFFLRETALERAVVHHYWPKKIILEISLDTRLSCWPILPVLSRAPEVILFPGGCPLWHLYWIELWVCLLSLWTGHSYSWLNCRVSWHRASHSTQVVTDPPDNPCLITPILQISMGEVKQLAQVTLCQSKT